MPSNRFDQGDTGTVDRSRSDIVVGVEMDIVAIGVVGTAIFGLLDAPPGSVAVLSGAGASRQFTPDVVGPYRVRIIDDNDGSFVRRTFTVRTALGMDLPASNETANEDANDVENDAADILASESNEGGSFKGWHPKANAALRLLEAAILAIGNVVTQTGTAVVNFITGATGADNGAGPGGAGDDVGLLGGDGGDGTTGGGAGGGAGVTGADGGDSSVSGNGGLGGFVPVTGGKGGAANGASGDGGKGGDVVYTGGEGGPSASANQGNGGDMTLDAGPGNVGGRVQIGKGNATEIDTGNGSNKLQHSGGLYTPMNDLGSSGSTVTPDLSSSNAFKITLTGNVTLTFTNLSDGQSGRIHVTQDGIGSRTMVKGAGVVMPGGAIVLSGGVGETDTLAYEVVDGAVRVWVEALNFS